MFLTQKQKRVLATVAVSEVLAMSVWFAFSAVMGLYASTLHLNPAESGWVLASFQAGYLVAVVPVGRLSDLWDTRLVMILGAILAGVLTIAVGFWADSLWALVLLRFLTGMAITGVYTPGIKLLSSYLPSSSRGRAVGLFVGALVLGSASSLLLGAYTHLLGKTGMMLLLGSLAVVAGLTLATVPPKDAEPNTVVQRDHPVGSGASIWLVNFGYMAHMWELYAMWGWLGPFFVATLLQKGMPMGRAQSTGDVAAFFVIAAGAPASYWAGRLSDRLGRTLVILRLLSLSGIISLGYGYLAVAPFWLLIVLGLIYGFAIVGDSPLFSVAITELAPKEKLGFYLGVQSVLGYGVTVVSTALFGWLVSLAGYGAAFLMLGLGALMGTLAVYRLRKHQDAYLLAQGRR